MTPATTALVIRVLKLREATDRAALAEAHHEQARRAAAASSMAEAIARELAFVASSALPASPVFAVWREAAAGRLADRHRAATDAEAACEAPHQALTDTIRLRRGFETLCKRRADAAERDTQRRDPLNQLISTIRMIDR